MPIWRCPIRAADRARPVTLYPPAPGTRYVKVGFCDVVEVRPAGVSRAALPADHWIVRRLLDVGAFFTSFSSSTPSAYFASALASSTSQPSVKLRLA